VRYGGKGAYFLDRVRPGVWRLEVYPDAVPVRDPFEPPAADKIVTRAISRRWPMTVALNDLGASFLVEPVAGGQGSRAERGTFQVMPGVYLLSARPVAPESLPSHVGALAFAEYHAPPPDTLGPVVESLAPAEQVAGRDVRVEARVVSSEEPDSVKLFIRRAAGDWYHGYWMAAAGAYTYQVTVPGDSLRPGPHDYVITHYRGGVATTFPGAIPQQPWDWNYNGRPGWTLNVVSPAAPVVLFEPGADANRLAFTRIGDAGRRGLFALDLSATTGRPVFRLRLPAGEGGAGLPDYTASLVVRDRIVARGPTLDAGSEVTVRLRGLASSQLLHLTLMETDGTSWSARVPADTDWNEVRIPLTSFSVGRGVLLPQGFPGQWNYWVGPAAGRGGAGDGVRVENIERIQVSLRPEPGWTVSGVEVEWVILQ
jgi:hypothetical protein